mgnify:CR=1 FL=1
MKNRPSDGRSTTNEAESSSAPEVSSESFTKVDAPVKSLSVQKIIPNIQDLKASHALAMSTIVAFCFNRNQISQERRHLFFKAFKLIYRIAR